MRSVRKRERERERGRERERKKTNLGLVASKPALCHARHHRVQFNGLHVTPRRRSWKRKKISSGKFSKKKEGKQREKKFDQNKINWR